MSIPERVYRTLLRAYPAGYRNQFGEPMAQCFRDQIRDASSVGSKIRICLRALGDLALTVPARHLERRHPAFALSQSLRRSLFFARNEASSFRRREITLDHLLLGLLRHDRELAEQLGPEAIEAIVRVVEDAEGRDRSVPPMETLPLAAEARGAARRAAELAERAGSCQVESRHLLTAILEQAETRAARLLQRHGLS